MTHSTLVRPDDAIDRKPVKVHSAANIFPLMSGDEFEQLKADIQSHGQREPIVYYRGELLDGRNRLRACEELGIQVMDCEMEESEAFDPVAYVLSANLHRRHLSESQRAMIAARIKEQYQTDAHQRQTAVLKKGQQKPVVENLPQRSGKARDQAGAAVNVSGKLVDHASTVLAKGSKELIAKVEAGEVSVSKAAAISKMVSVKLQASVADQPLRASKRDMPLSFVAGSELIHDCIGSVLLRLGRKCNGAIAKQLRIFADTIESGDFITEDDPSICIAGEAGTVTELKAFAAKIGGAA